MFRICQNRQFTTSQLKVDAAEIRLSRWGEALGIYANSSVTIPEENYKHAEKVLKHLEGLFAQARDKAEIFAKPDTQTYDEYELDPQGAIVHRSILAKINKRIDRTHISRVEKTKWALYKKKELNSLVEDISALVDQLEHILPLSIEPECKLQSLVEIEVEEIQGFAQQDNQQVEVTPLQIAETLNEAAKAVDPHLEEVVKKIVSELQKSSESSTTYNIKQTVGKVKNTSGIITSVYHGNHISYYGKQSRNSAEESSEQSSD